ncbi:hypothetical protein OZ410_07180 [Robiginitalea sp. M366]|uniref:hypothetical protein n=1 Tax=Robiginitalea aestuariiviva TaxID=3036903 RepID=UPI00240D9686|nr:hypothetical protein [Robiginitalea aestuariiviva]MDG1572093.1 hypothetical protein [Robiginitalea aestuariiviva]
MKKYKFLIGLFSGLLFLQTGCEDGETVFDDIISQEQRGAILRTISVLSDEIPIGNDSSYFGVTLEVQDQENGALVSAIDVFVGFRDNTVADGEPDLDTGEVLAATLDASTFTIGEFGLPRTTYEITLPELVAALPISNADVDGSDQFTIRFELVMTDGRRFSNDDNSGTLTGSFFRSPFLYTATVVCPPKAPTPGVWTINMTDSYGDGWQTTTGGGGDGITVTLDDGTVLEVGMCSPYGSAAGTFLGSADCTANDGFSGTGTITIPVGTQTADWYFPGDFYGEIGFEIITPNGNVVGGYTGVSAGPITIDFCKD